MAGWPKSEHLFYRGEGCGSRGSGPGTYADEAIFINNLRLGVVRGKAVLRAYWTGALSLFTPAVLSSLTVTQQEIEGEIAYLLWSAEPEIPFGSDTFLVREGKIMTQTATVQVRSRKGWRAGACCSSKML